MSDKKHDVVGQLQQVLRHLERSILLITPLAPKLRRQHAALRRLRDQLEEAFTVEQTERLRKGSLNFAVEVADLKKVTDDLEAATARAAKAKEVVGYVSLAVDLATRLLATVLPFLGV